MTQQKWLSRQEAAELLRVPLETVDRLIATGALTRYRLNGLYVRVSRAEVGELAQLPTDVLRNA